jgi:hypothetical protein
MGLIFISQGGASMEQTTKLAEYEKIITHGGINLKTEPTLSWKVSVEGSEKLIDSFKSRIKGDTLILRNTNPSVAIDVTAFAKEISSVEMNGSGDIDIRMLSSRECSLSLCE